MSDLPRDLKLYAERLKGETWRGKTPAYQGVMLRAADKISELEQKLGLTEIALEHKTRHLESCEKALAQRDFPEHT